MKKEILLTGATGFVGKAILKELFDETDFSVTAIVRDRTRLPGDLSGKVKIVEADITDTHGLEKAMKGKCIIIHCAALMSNFDDKPKQEFFDTNVTGTLNLVKCLDTAVDPFFIHVSTAGVYGWCERDVPCDESSPYGGTLSVYEWSKKEAEIALMRASQERGVRFTILRPSQMYGAGMYYGWLEIIRSISKGGFYIPGNGSAKIHLLNIKDLVRAVKLLIRFSGPGKKINTIYNIAGPEVLKFNEVVSLLSSLLSKRLPARVPYFPLYAAASVLDMLPRSIKPGALALLSAHRMRFFSKHHFYDSAKAREFGFVPSVMARDGFMEMITWAREENLL